MKKLIQTLALAAVVVVSGASFTACKKGENDPALSLKSRKGRLTGEWKLTKGTYTSTSGSSTATRNYDGTSFTESSGGSSITGTFAWTLTIDKEGTYEFKQSETSGGTTSTTTEKGRWSFLGKNGEVKNKEAILMSRTSTSYSSGTSTSTTTISGFYDETVFMIDQLKNKEMILKGKSSYTNGSYTETNEYSLTFKQD
ncbi:MAG: hypothetical protein EBS07_10040 [Sphingobacteriia bacterium]|nr:hypothetical protein [Sphingobacteriia bacterium]